MSTKQLFICKLTFTLFIFILLHLCTPLLIYAETQAPEIIATDTPFNGTHKELLTDILEDLQKKILLNTLDSIQNEPSDPPLVPDPSAITYTIDVNNQSKEPTLLLGNEFTFTTVAYKGATSYVQYKLNDLSIETITTGSYDFIPPKDALYPGMNHLKVVIYPITENAPFVQEFYLNYTGSTLYEERSPRSNIVYTQTSTHASIPVLMYHKFLPTVAEDQQSIAVSTSLFKAQLEKLLEEGYTPIDFMTIFSYFKEGTPLPKKSILITSDDGYLCNYENAYPILKEYNVPATFFISTAYVGIALDNPHFSWEHAQEMEKSGLIDIQSHSHTHRKMDTLTQSEIQYEMNLSFSLIESYLGERDVKVLAYPQFRHTQQTKDWVSETGVDLQVTRLLKKPIEISSTSIERIHVSNLTTPTDLIKEIEKVTKR